MRTGPDRGHGSPERVPRLKPKSSQRHYKRYGGEECGEDYGWRGLLRGGADLSEALGNSEQDKPAEEHGGPDNYRLCLDPLLQFAESLADVGHDLVWSTHRIHAWI
jgi:hypothetical protein